MREARDERFGAESKGLGELREKGSACAPNNNEA